MQVLELKRSDDGASKALLQLDDGARIEAVFLEHDHVGKDSICISSQVGCSLACTFCVTGTLGFHRNLTCDEIVDQVLTVFRFLGFVPRRRLDISFMGMGEPLLNLREVLEAKRKLSDLMPSADFHLSTVGIPNQIRRLGNTAPDVGLQISLHAARDDLRDSIVPLNQRYPIASVLAAGEHYAAASPHEVTLNYCLMAGVNDDVVEAQRLAALVQDRPFRVQLVNVNPHLAIGQLPTDESNAERFLAVLRAAGIAAHYGRQLGSREGAGCGQLDADYAPGTFVRVRPSKAR